jgi:hypothetical protein
MYYEFSQKKGPAPTLPALQRWWNQATMLLLRLVTSVVRPVALVTRRK